MTPKELLENVKQYGVHMTERSLRDYKERYKCIPEPQNGRFGTGGAWSDYPKHAPAELVASWMLIKGKLGIKARAEVMQAVRLRALEAEQWEVDEPGKVAELLTCPSSPVDTLAWYWLLEKHKVLAGIPQDAKGYSLNIKPTG